MKPLSFKVTFPALSADIDKWKSHIETSGELPSLAKVEKDVAAQVQRWFLLYLIQRGDLKKAQEVLASVNRDDFANSLGGVWLYLAEMSILIEQKDFSESLFAGEQCLRALASIGVDKTDKDYVAIVAGVLYNLALIHNQIGENGRAEKELVKAQKIFEKLAKKDKDRFGEALINSVEASTTIFNSRLKQMNVLAHYQVATDMYLNKANRGTTQAILDLVNSLKEEGDLHLKIGNYRDAVKYYTKALRYQKKITSKMGKKDLEISINLGKALLHIINRQATGEQLLRSLIPLAERLDAKNEINEINSILEHKGRSFDFVSFVKKLFAITLLTSFGLSAHALELVGHRGSLLGVENTAEAFENGAKQGFHALECDIHMTSDRKFAVMHDADLIRLGGDSATIAENATLEQLKAVELTQKRKNGNVYTGRVCDLQEYLDICKRNSVTPVIEIKWSKWLYSNSKDEQDFCYDGVPALMEILKTSGMADNAILLTSMKGVLEHIRATYPSMKLQLLSSRNWRQHVDWCRDHKIDIDVEKGGYGDTFELVKIFHEMGLKVNVWTIDTPREFQKLKDAGVDMITSNVKHEI